MVKIPTYDAPATLDVPNAPFYPRRFEQVPDLGAGAARGAEIAARNLQGFGAGVENVGHDVQSIIDTQKAQADEAWVANARAQTTLDWAKQENDLFNGAMTQTQPGAGLSAPAVSTQAAKPLPDQAKAALETYSGTLVKAAPSSRAAAAYKNWFADFSANAQIKAYDAERTRLSVQKVGDLTDALGKHTQLVAGDPTQFNAAWAAADSDLTEASKWADPKALQALRAKTLENMQWARARTLATQQPLAFLNEVTPQKGSYDAASGEMGPSSKGFVGSPYYSKLDVNQIAGLTADAHKAVVEQHITTVAAQRQEHDQQYNNLMTSLLPGGGGGMADILKARQDGWLTDYKEIKGAVDAFDQNNKENMLDSQAFALFQTGHNWNPFDEGDKKAVDRVYKLEGGADGLVAAPQAPGLSAPTPGTPGDPKAQAAIRLNAFVDKTQIVPQSAIDEVRRGMVSPDPDERMTAFSTLDGLSRSNPSAVKQAFGEADMKLLDQYRVLAPITSRDDLVKAMNPNVDAGMAKQRADLRDTGKKLIDAEVKAGNDYIPDIVSHFNPGFMANVADWKSSPIAPKDPLELQALRQDYEATFLRLYSLSGDEVSSKAGALNALDRKWGVSEIGSSIQVMPNPPERFFPAISGSHDWMDHQAEDQVNHAFPGAQSWSAVTLPETEGAIGIRQTPSYGLFVEDKDGTYHVLTPPAGAKPGWPFDYDAAHVQAVSDFNATRGSLLNAGTPPGPGPGHATPYNALSDRIARSVQLPPPLPQYPESAFSPSKIEPRQKEVAPKQPQAFLGVRG